MSHGRRLLSVTLKGENMLDNESELVEQILQDRYYIRGETSWEQIARRVARYVAAAGVARGDSKCIMRDLEELFYHVISKRLFIPNSPTLFNAGLNTDKELLYKDINDMSEEDYKRIYESRHNNGSLSACFVVPIEDSMDSIYTALKNMALITQSGGGVGFDFSPLRPAGCPVNGVGGVSSGPLPFMKAFDVSADAIKQGGKRRAALMGILDYTHPDALDFVKAKRKNDGQSVLSYFNISLDVDPVEFSSALDNDTEIEFRHERTGKTGSIKAREYLRIIAENAWASGDPGMVFTSAHNDVCAYSNIEMCNSSNPCWTGDTKVWTTKGPIEFRELAETGADVGVLTMSKTGELCIRQMRAPRMTMESSAILSILLDNGETLRCTPDHSLYLLNGKKVRAKNLKPGDVLRHAELMPLRNAGMSHAAIAERLEMSPYLVASRLTFERTAGLGRAVVSISEVEATEPVYNGTVDETHSYFVMSGNDSAVLSGNCGEQLLPKMGSCNLGSIDISKTGVDIESVVFAATIFLDSVIDINIFPIPELAETNQFYRDIGVGIMGVHDYLINERLRYDSEEGRIAVAKIVARVTQTAYNTSSMLAKLWGKAPAYDRSRFEVHKDFVPVRMLDLPEMQETNEQLLEALEAIRAFGLRNMSVTTIAPTGTISQLAGPVSSGIEPHFSYAYTRNMMSKTGERVPLVWKHKSVNGIENPTDIDRVMSTGSLYSVTGDETLKSAQEIAPEDHLLMQAYAQAYISNSISKTINLPQEATVEDIEAIYRQAKTRGGIILYRYTRSKSGEQLSGVSLIAIQGGLKALPFCCA